MEPRNLGELLGRFDAPCSPTGDAGAEQTAVAERL
jgi:hypothetical protein